MYIYIYIYKCMCFLGLSTFPPTHLVTETSHCVPDEFTSSGSLYRSLALRVCGPRFAARQMGPVRTC